jgi:hypothetical protein
MNWISVDWADMARVSQRHASLTPMANADGTQYRATLSFPVPMSPAWPAMRKHLSSTSWHKRRIVFHLTQRHHTAGGGLPGRDSRPRVGMRLRDEGDFAEELAPPDELDLPPPPHPPREVMAGTAPT